jgi:hypothetical protein
MFDPGLFAYVLNARLKFEREEFFRSNVCKINLVLLVFTPETLRPSFTREHNLVLLPADIRQSLEKSL